MPDYREILREIRTFPSLIKFLRDELDWPISSEDFEELTFDYTPEELGIDTANAAKIQEIKRLRPLSINQPWGIFFVKFEPKKLPVVALRRILSRVTLKKRASANAAERPAWQMDDLLFVSNYGEEGDERQISFAHFAHNGVKNDLPTLKVLGWDNLDTPLHLDHVADVLSERLAWPEDEDDAERWRETWRSAFTLRHREVITTSKVLAVRLAELARAIHDRLNTVLAIETEDGPVTKLMAAFKEALVHDLDEDGFADMYAQTIAYGLLSARIANPAGNTADDFTAQMPVTSPFLKELMETFLHVGGRKGKKGSNTGIDFDELGVSEVVDLLDDANMEAVVRDFGDRNPQEDPVIHFYEHFLAAYDKKQKVQRGVFYTPRPVVSYIVRSVDELLRTEFGLEDGLADTTTWDEMVEVHKDLTIPEGISPEQTFVQILDPATGTGTFLVEVIDFIHKTLVAKWEVQGHSDKKIDTLWNEYVPDHLLPRLHGFELLMAPYAIAHLKIGLKLFETGYGFGSDERAQVYLTNALEAPHDFSGSFEFTIPALAHEAEEVNKIKLNQRFTVIIGNPPYNNRSDNKTQWIMDLIEIYKATVRSEETQIQALSDDYIKFIRLADWSVSRAGAGIVGMITNNGFLDGHLFRDLRSHLVNSFSVLRFINLHGDTRKKERAPDRTADKNVFDIMQGVSIAVMCKTAKHNSPDILYTDLWGEREVKYRALSKVAALDQSWVQVDPCVASKMFMPTRETGEEWKLAVPLVDCFGTGNWQTDKTNAYGSGYSSRQDEFAIAFSPEELVSNIEQLLKPEMTEAELRSQFSLCTTKHWEFDRARRRLSGLNWRDQIRRVLFRPFDFRFTLLHPDIVAEYRPEIVKQFEEANIALLSTRKATEGFAIFVANIPPGKKIVGNYDTTIVFPLYRYINEDENTLVLEQNRKLVNISPDFIRKLVTSIGQKQSEGECQDVAPETILNYAYAVFHSSTFRKRHEEPLKNDFPRLLLPGSVELLGALARIGGELVTLHLMESPKLERLITTYTGPKSPTIGHVRWANNTTWFDAPNAKKDLPDTPCPIGIQGVPETVWNFHIGSYQVCEKWLKDRKGRTLTNEDIYHYQKIIVALNETIRIMGEIDEVIEEHGGWPDAFVHE